MNSEDNALMVILQAIQEFYEKEQKDEHNNANA